DLNGQLILSELLWPEDVQGFEAPAPVEQDEMTELAEQVITEKLVTDFDPDVYKKEARNRLATLVQSVQLGQPAPAQKAGKVDDGADTLAALKAALGQ